MTKAVDIGSALAHAGARRPSNQPKQPSKVGAWLQRLITKPNRAA